MRLLKLLIFIYYISEGQECQSSCTLLAKVCFQLNAKYLLATGEAIIIFHQFDLIEHITNLYFNLQMN